MIVARLSQPAAAALLSLLITTATIILSCESDRITRDTTRPHEVTDLSLDSIRANSLFFSWTATGDDNTRGRASFYDLRYSHDQATLRNWGNATVTQGEPVPSEPGTHEVMELLIAPVDSTYYFGIKVSDDSRNTSPLSNIVTYQP